MKVINTAHLWGGEVPKSIGNDRKVRTEEEKASAIFVNDCYGTPPWATRAILHREPELINVSVVLDPVSGQGYMAKELEEYPRGAFPLKRTVLASDLRKGKHIYGKGGVDFLSRKSYQRSSIDATCGNPPFSLTCEIVERAIEVTRPGGLVAMFQRTQLLESDGRYQRLFKVGDLKCLYPFVQRVNTYPEGQVDHRESGKMAFGWFVWKVGYRGNAEIIFIPEGFKNHGKEALLPQEAGLCRACHFRRGKKGCTIELAPKKIKVAGLTTPRDGQLTPKLCEWLFENVDHGPGMKPGEIGLDLGMLCFNWKARI